MADAAHRPGAPRPPRHLGGSRLTLGIAPEPQEVRRARSEVRSILAIWYAEESVGDVLVVISELVTNAVRHAPRPEIGLTATCGGGLLLIEVEDGSAEPPILRHDPEAGAECGRGLGLVQSLTSDWGWTPQHNGTKRVWALLPVSERGALSEGDGHCRIRPRRRLGHVG